MDRGEAARTESRGGVARMIGTMMWRQRAFVGDGIPALSADGKRFVFAVVSTAPVTAPHRAIVIAAVAGEKAVTRLPLQSQLPDQDNDGPDPAKIAAANAVLARTTWKTMRGLPLICREGESTEDGHDGEPCRVLAPRDAFVYDVKTAVLDGTILWESGDNRLTYRPRTGGTAFAKTYPRWTPRYQGGEGPMDCANEVWPGGLLVADDDKTVLFATELRVDHQCDSAEDVVHAVTLP